MLRPQGEQLRDRLIPTVVRLVRQTGNQVEADILETSIAKNLGRAIDVVAAVHAARRFQLIVLKGLHAHADAIESGLAPCGGLLRDDRFGIGFEGDLFESAFECGTHGIEDSRQTRRIKQAWRSPAEIGCIDDGFRTSAMRDSRIRWGYAAISRQTASTYGAYKSFENTPVWKLQ